MAHYHHWRIDTRNNPSEEWVLGNPAKGSLRQLDNVYDVAANTNHRKGFIKHRVVELNPDGTEKEGI